MTRIFIAGFGGQGIQFTGKFLAYAGMLKGLEVSQMPSYGPESRGGTSNCSVILSKTPIGSPVVLSPDILICMNAPSLDKYEDTLPEHGTLYIDSSLITREITAPCAAVHKIPATKLAYDNGLEGLANMVMLGKVIRESAVCDLSLIIEAMKKVVPERKKDMFDGNMKAVDIGLHYAS